MEETLKETQPGVEPGLTGYKYSDGQWQDVPLAVPREMAFTIYVNSLELVTILCTPVKLNCLVIGYLYAEDFISDLSEIAAMRVCEDDALADIKLSRPDFKMPEKKVLTSGCGGGVSFSAETLAMKVTSNLTVKPEQVLRLMKQMMENAALYRSSGGIHTSAIADGKGILATAEDIGRHNTLDKIMGECLLRKISTQDKILLTSGRISSEMLRKAARMQCPVVCSMTSPTDRAVLLAKELDVTLIGYARGNHLTVYANPERVRPG